MILRLERRWPKESYTIGRLYVNGKFLCNTLEDKVVDINRNGYFDGREKKVAGETAIPYGTYRVMYNWSSKFGRMLPRLVDVPSFEGILIHPGNTVKDTSGCILVGLNKEVGKLSQSRYYSDVLNGMIRAAQAEGELITIEIV
jgi:hypothetical protein